MDKNAGGKDAKKNVSMKQVGPILEVSSVKPGDKKQQKKTVIAASTKATAEPPEATGCTKTDVGNEKPPLPEAGAGHKKMADSFIVCSHIAEQVDLDTLKSIARKNGIDLDHTKEEKKALDKELKQRIRAWKKCPCRMDFRYVCRDPVTGQPCPTVQALMTPRLPDPQLLETSSRLPPGTIGVARHQVAIHSGGSRPHPTTNDPHFLELGRRDDGTMCVTVQYSPDPGPLPEYFCTTVRETQAALEGPGAPRKSKKSAKGKGKKGKK